MGVPAAVLIPSALSLASSFFGGRASKKQSERNIDFQRQQNQQQREWETSMALLQRHWAKKDQRHYEQYNDPTQQMLRLKSAGLNPHLMYGQGTVGTTEMPRSTSVSTSRLDAPQDTSSVPEIIGSALPNAYSSAILAKDLELKEQQRKNLETIDTLNNVRAIKTQEDTNTTRYNREYKQQFSDIMYDKILRENERTQADTQLKVTSAKVQSDDQSLRNLRYSLDKSRFEWQKVVDAQKMAKTQREIANLEEQRVNIVKDQLLKTIKAAGDREKNILLTQKWSTEEIRQRILKVQADLTERDFEGTPENIKRWLDIAEFVLGKKRSRF